MRGVEAKDRGMVESGSERTISQGIGIFFTSKRPTKMIQNMNDSGGCRRLVASGDATGVNRHRYYRKQEAGSTM